MAKFLNRLACRLALANLKESKNWIVTRKLICETDEGDVEFEAGDSIEVGGDEEGNMVLDGSAAVVVISDPEIAEKVADVLASADELSDVDFVEKPALDAVLDGEDVEDVVDALGDSEDDNVEVAEVSVDDEKKESVENKYAKFAENTIHAAKMLACESVQIEENASPINMSNIKRASVKKESYNDYKEFAARVAALKGSIKPGTREIALTEAGEAFGAYDTEADAGMLYPENSWKSEDEMDNFDDAPVAAVEDMTWEDDEDAMAVESCLGKYEESAKSGKDYVALTESLEKAGLKEEKIAKIVSTFGAQDLKESVKVFDNKYGKFIATFKESVDCNNFIAEAGENRFSKRYFA
jgi:uncharacterized protein with PIN domain